MTVRALRFAAGIEAASLVILLVNLFTAHLPAITSLGGPIHGTAYLVVIAATFLVPASPSARWLAVIPGIGGLLALRQFSRA
ncbi:DUF3817 domain-containing protein [Saccharopolyspora spinosa]|uniref:DUF3817 domain-containing protein n=1 Tax=Saccharopolyspora spinosa TaxID=60894 RepID=A0A2N3XSU3_SACSN|nr:hypothetical protein [Saccharopolyspora spinosa]PKW13744.1 hypothetical protein A8926_1299 [Saccharopolyspora spinosa]